MIRRRRLLGTATVGTAGVLIASGCQLLGSDGSGPAGASGRGTETGGSGPPGEPDRPDPDLPLLGRLITAEHEMISAYRVAIDAFPELPEWCREHLNDHRQHLRALTELAAAARGSDAAPSPSDSPAATTPGPPSGPKSAVRALRQREQESVAARDQRLSRAHGGALARLIASVAASDALHRDRFAEESA